jgi:hypothetical protein
MQIEVEVPLLDYAARPKTNAMPDPERTNPPRMLGRAILFCILVITLIAYFLLR